VVTFDFSGCGNSEGKYLSLGWFEAKDLKLIMKNLRQRKELLSFSLWGRSMGAVTALLYTGLYDKDINCLVLDSPFSSLKELTLDVISEKTGLPKMLGSPIFSYIQTTIQEKANFDLELVSPKKYISKNKMSALFIHGKKDTLV